MQKGACGVEVTLLKEITRLNLKCVQCVKVGQIYDFHIGKKMNILPLQCFSPTAQQLYLRVLVSLHLAVGLSVSPETLFHILLCSSLLVLQLLLQLVDPETTTQDNR